MCLRPGGVGGWGWVGQNSPRTPEWLAPGWEGMVARSHYQACQALEKAGVCTEGLSKGPVWGL